MAKLEILILALEVGAVAILVSMIARRLRRWWAERSMRRPEAQ